MQVQAVLLLAVVGVCHCQFFQPIAAPTYHQFTSLSPPPLPVGRAINFQPSPVVMGHRAVILNAEQESHLPEQLKNPFYKNPRIAQALAKESWFINGEEEVKVREAEKIPRQKVYNILKHAGFI